MMISLVEKLQRRKTSGSSLPANIRFFFSSKPCAGTSCQSKVMPAFSAEALSMRTSFHSAWFWSREPNTVSVTG